MVLIQQPQYFSQFADTIPIIVWTACADGRVDFANDLLTSYTGISSDALLGEKFWSNILHIDDLIAAGRIWNESIVTSRTFQAELRIRRYDGVYRWHLVRATPIRFANEQNLKWHGIAIDINDRNESEARAQRLAERLATTLESITDAFFTLDCSWCFTYINNEAERLLRRSREDLKGKNIWEEYPAAIGTAFEQHYRASVKEGKKVSFEANFSPLNTWFSVNAYPSSEGLAVYFQNIDGRLRSEEQLKLLKTCVEKMNDIVIITEAEPQDEPGPRIVFVNNAFTNRTGYSRAEVIGRSPRFLQGKNTQRDELKRIKQAIAALQPVRAELINYTKSGEEYWLEIDLVPVADTTGSYTHWVAVERDISERKLQDIDRRRMIELEQSQQVAELANQAKSQFLATMSHEIRTPISGVTSMVEVLQQTELNHDQREIVEVIRESAASLLEIVDDILDFSKIEAGKLELEIGPINIEKVIKSVCSLLDRFALNKGVELTYFWDPQIPEVLLGDELRLRQVLLNLINNAIKFSSGKGRLGKVKIRAQLIVMQEAETSLTFHVIDNGIGMTEATMNRLFTPFMQADVSTTRHFGGTGLGLSICHHLVDLMGGKITVASAPNQGCHFSVNLALASGPKVAESLRTLPDLAGIVCVVLGETERLGDEIAIYLRAAKVAMARVADLSALEKLVIPATAGTERVVWVIDANLPKVWLHALAATPYARDGVVVIERGQRRSPRRIGVNQISVDGNILDRQNLFRAIVMAADLEQGEAQSGIGQTHGVKAAIKPMDVAKPRTSILVAEDNETNQKVIARQLALLGYGVDIANNGREALNLWQSGCYGILLTDLHMPDIDGYELVKRIRSLTGERGSAPIIGLSANTLQGEDRRCRELGMNDYLIKPVSLEKLKAVIERWLPYSSNPLQVDFGVSNPVKVEILSGLVGDDRATILEFLDHYHQDLSRLSENLLQAFVENNITELAVIAHKLKSSSRSVGALTLGDLCETLECCAKKEELERIPRLINAFQEESKRVCIFLQDAYQISNQ